MTYFDNSSSPPFPSHKPTSQTVEILPPGNLSGNPFGNQSGSRLAAAAGNPAETQAARLSKMREMLPLLITLLASRLGQRGAAGLATMLRSMMRKVYAQERALIIERIKHALRRSPEWQARVFDDLGGAAGLARWQARLMRAWTPKPEDDPGHSYDWLDDDPDDWPVIESPAPRIRKGAARRSIPLTDRDGLFRWAKIKLGRDTYGRAYNPREREPYETFFNGKSARGIFPGPWPIEVLPSDVIDSDVEERDIRDWTQDEAAAADDPLMEWNTTQTELRALNARAVPIYRKIWPQKLWPESVALCLAPP